MNCHKKCEKLTANLCGVNQKLVHEALSSVRRGKMKKKIFFSSNQKLKKQKSKKLERKRADKENQINYKILLSVFISRIAKKMNLRFRFFFFL